VFYKVIVWLSDDNVRRDCEAGNMSECWGVSIIVVNYNNAEFLAAAIDSALAQDYPLCEVIVVDDCSTDHSRAIILRYGGRIRCLFRDTNGGQVVAQDSAWPLARYPILIFLDSDDLLLPNAAATVAGLWTAETVKVQFPLATIDKTGRQLGHVAPKYPPDLDTATLRAELLRTGGSPNSPGSGNAYSRALLERLRTDGAFALENPRDYHMDAVLECNSPFYGEVTTLYEPLACYRIHDNNIYAMNAVENARFAMKCRTFELKVDYFARRCRQWGVAFDATAARNSSIWLQECRLAAAKIDGRAAAEPIAVTLYRAIKACIGAPLPATNRIFRIVWFMSIAGAPRPVARWLIEFRFVPSLRPVWFEPLLMKALGAAGRARGQARAPRTGSRLA
jgi:glycosyltransferase involved in cell wall biosynthesis